MEQPSESGTELEPKTAPEARVCLLIQTHALPSLSYHIPKDLRDEVRVGAVVVAPLSGYSRLGVVVELGDWSQATEDISSVLGEYSIPSAIIELSQWVSEAAVVPLTTVLRAALPPGISSGSYRILEPLPDWPWQAGELVGRPTLRRTLGGPGLRDAEREGRVELVVQEPGRRVVEWAYVNEDEPPDLSRAPRQRELFDALAETPEGRAVKELLLDTGASRATLRALVGRGAISLEQVPEPPPLLVCEGGSNVEALQALSRQAGRVVDVGGAWIWRTPVEEYDLAVAAVAQAAIEGGEQALILVPEIGAIERLVSKLYGLLSRGQTVATYHSGMVKDRGAVFELAKNGQVDVLIGTRSAAMIPMPRLGAICVVDEPNAGHRAEPGYEGLPIHVREIASERGRIEDTGTLFLSPYPSLRLYAEKPHIKELPSRTHNKWPTARIFDIRGSGLSLSPTLIESCRRSVEAGKRVGIIANRLGHATSVSCNSCGAVQSCPNCDLPLALHKTLLTCARCGLSRKLSAGCDNCGSQRLTPTGMTVEKVRDEVSQALKRGVGLSTASGQDKLDASVVVGTAHSITSQKWDIIAIADIDALLQGSGLGSVERAFRMIFASAEAANEQLMIQTRYPEHYALQAALRGDYSGFAASELPRLRQLGYPPFGHLATLVFEGARSAVQLAVESELRPDLDPEVAVSDVVPATGSGRKPAWKVLLRSREREAVARAATLVVRSTHGKYGLKVRAEIDPEEV